MKRYVYDMKALKVYADKLGITPNKMSQMTGIPTSTFYRYVKGEVKADIQLLVDICNKLHISISMFIHAPNEDFSSMKIYEPELWVNIEFRSHRLESIRQSRGMSLDDVVTFLNSWDKPADTPLKRDTVYRVLNCQSSNYDVIVESLNAFDLQLESLFVDNQLPHLASSDNSLLIRREDFLALKSQIKHLAEENKLLRTRLARAERKLAASPDNQLVTAPEATRIAKKYISSAERALAQLRAIAYANDTDSDYLPDPGHAPGPDYLPGPDHAPDPDYTPDIS